MDKNTAQQLIKETFQNPFDKERFIYFIQNLLNLEHKQIESKHPYSGKYIPDAYKGYISTLERIAKYTDSENEIDILVVKLKKESSLGHARTMQRNFIAWYLNGSRGGKLKDAALVAFVSPNSEDWRFSLVKMDYRFDTSAEKVKVRQELTPARRYSFLVGAHESSHTAQSYLVPILQDDSRNPTLKDLEKSFSIEKVTKEFFEKYRKLFLRVKEELDKIVQKDSKIKKDFKEKNINTVDFTKKLLGQIVFLYFLQKKGWFGVQKDKNWGTGPKDFLRVLFKKEIVKYNNFFNDILEPLFYEALRSDRSYDDHYFSYFKCKIPFLNGGLFDPINDYNWSKTDIFLPNEVFSNNEKTKEGDIGTGILDIFDRYNFTVKEDEPLEKEVAVDPEMLGKVFENLLEVKDRKSKGTYYTPREIVHYMCQQSLINYLATELKDKVEKEDIEIFIKYGETFVENEFVAVKKQNNIQNGEQKSTSIKSKLPQSIIKNVSLIDEQLKSIYVCDPAVGSGAFLVGMMHEIIRARNALTPYFESKKNRTMYNFKRHAIQSCLYGVDIDSGAVEIAKLRLWLSLIVDEENIKQIKPLPNLDYKIMQGNSLIELLSSEFLDKTDDNKRNELIDKFDQAKKKFFNITSVSKKTEKRNEIDKLLKELFEYDRNLIINNLKQEIQSIQNQGRLFKDRKLEAEDKKKIRDFKNKIKECSKLKDFGPSDHFEWHINFSEVFQEKNGFDVVIANPPYIDYRKIDKNTKSALPKFYSYQKSKTGNLYIYFIELGLDLLNGNGIATYINPFQYLTADSAVGLREFLIHNSSIMRIVNVSNIKVFEASVYTSINFFRKMKIKQNQIEIIQCCQLEDLQKNGYKILQDSISANNQYLISVNPYAKLIDKLEDSAKRLGNLCKIFCGTSSGGFSKLIINAHQYNLLVAKERNNYCIIKQSSNIRRYYVNSEISYIHKKIYPVNTLQDFYKPKILFARMTKWIRCTYTENNYCAGKVNVLVDFQESPKYLLALLNSRLINFWYSSKFESKHLSGGYLSFDIPSVKFIPIKIAFKNVQKKVINLASKILTITKNPDYFRNKTKQRKVKEHEYQIDRLIYKLYGLTPKEIKIVENFNKKIK